MPSKEVVEACRIRRAAAVKIVKAEGYPVSIRNVFYRLVSGGLVEKDKRGYDKVVDDFGVLRRNGSIDYEEIADDSRSPLGYTSSYNLTAEAAIKVVLETAEPITSIWEENGLRPHIWVESRSIAGMIRGITDNYEVALWPAGGMPSLTITFRGAEDDPTHIGYIGDYDKAGKHISDNVKSQLAEHNSQPDFTPIAVTEEQIETLSLPVRYEDDKAGSRTKKVEAEAIPGGLLREMVEDYLLGLLPEGAWNEYLIRREGIAEEIQSLVDDFLDILE